MQKLKDFFEKPPIAVNFVKVLLRKKVKNLKKVHEIFMEKIKCIYLMVEDLIKFLFVGKFLIPRRRIGRRFLTIEHLFKNRKVIEEQQIVPTSSVSVS